MSLDDAVQAFREYYASLPARIDAKALLRKRPLALYAAMGISTARGLADALVQDRLAASREMAMGYLYERVLEDVCSAEKLDNAQKKEWRGIDFRKSMPDELLLINLKSARATSNSDISQQTLSNLASAGLKAAEIEAASVDDNPLRRRLRRTRAVRAIARGNSSRTTKNHGGVEIEVLVGDALWEALGAGSDLTRRLQELLAENPVDEATLTAATTNAIGRVERAIRETECVDDDGVVDWSCLFRAYPDA